MQHNFSLQQSPNSTYLHKTYKRSPWLKEQSVEGMMAKGASVEGVMVEDKWSLHQRT